jgi:hypothetical protein
MTRAENARRMRNDPVWRLYASARWSTFKTLLNGFGNVYCQHIGNDGRRCNAVGTIWHHLLSPRECPAAFTDHRNVVKSCHACHPIRNGSDRPGNFWVPTLYAPPLTGLTVPDWYPQPGRAVPLGCPKWSVASVLAIYKPRPVTGQRATVSGVGAATLDAALGTADDIAALLDGVDL